MLIKLFKNIHIILFYAEGCSFCRMCCLFALVGSPGLIWRVLLRGCLLFLLALVFSSKQLQTLNSTIRYCQENIIVSCPMEDPAATSTLGDPLFFDPQMKMPLNQTAQIKDIPSLKESIIYYLLFSPLLLQARADLFSNISIPFLHSIFLFHSQLLTFYLSFSIISFVFIY